MRFLGVICWTFLLAVVPAAFAEQLTIGAILPLTGPAADYGISIKNCLELARADYPELFRDIKIVYEDAAYDAKLAVSAFHKVRTQDKVDFVYSWGVSFCKAIAPLAEQHHIPFVGQCIDSASSRGRKYVLRFMNSIEDYQGKTADYLNKNGKKRLAIILADNSYIGEMFSAFERQLRPGQQLEIIDRFPSEEMNFRSTITKLRRGNYDAVGVFLTFGQVSTFFRQMKEQGFRPYTFGTNIFEAMSEVRAAKGTMEGAVFAANEYHQEFAKRYRELFKNESQLSFGALAYEFMLTTAQLKQRHPVRDLFEQYGGVVNVPGKAAGPFSFTETEGSGKYMSFPVVMKRVLVDSVEEIRD